MRQAATAALVVALAGCTATAERLTPEAYALTSDGPNREPGTPDDLLPPTK